MIYRRVNCHKCKHYYVTWKPKKPHGCRAYGFESQQLPSVVVKNSSKMDCTLFIPKPIVK